jgi:hypothetical protein
MRSPTACYLLCLAGSAAAGELCTGIEKKFPRSGSVVCCPSACGMCGGAKCSKAPVPNAQQTCCPGPIVRSGKQCEAGDAGPCLIKRSGDPTCASGIIHSDNKHCFPAACGDSAGVEPDCDKAPGGRKACCIPSRRKADSPRECNKLDPPCVLSATPAAAVPLKPRPVRDALPASSAGAAPSAGPLQPPAGVRSTWSTLTSVSVCVVVCACLVASARKALSTD